MVRFSLGSGAMRCPQNTPAIPKTAAMGALTLAHSLHPSLSCSRRDAFFLSIAFIRGFSPTLSKSLVNE